MTEVEKRQKKLILEVNRLRKRVHILEKAFIEMLRKYPVAPTSKLPKK